jgi:hypothetical protein
MVTLFLALMISASHDDVAFFDRFSAGGNAAFAACKEGSDVRAIIYFDKLSNPDFVEIIDGHVGRMAHLSVDGRSFTLLDASGGQWTYQKIRDMVTPLYSSSLVVTDASKLKQRLISGADLSACSK